MGPSSSFTKMKGPRFLLGCCLLALASLVAVSQASAPINQKDINGLLWKPFEKLRMGRMGNAYDEGFSPIADVSMYSDDGAAAKHLEQDHQDGRLHPQKKYFSLFNPRHREEALMLFDVLMQCKEWAPCLVSNAVYFRERMNEGIFIYALYVTIIHAPIADGLVLPPLYEVTPHMFTNSEVINQAYTAKMTATPGKFTMGYTGSQKNPEQRVAYFGEDIGMNVHHVSWHMDFPFWWKDSYGYNLDRKGELFYWVHHQLTARFDAERLSNNLPDVDELYWDRPIKEGFAPHTQYKYGGEFPSRPDNIKFSDVEGVARIRDLMIWEDRIRDAIAHGYVTGKNGEIIDILNDRGVDIIGDIIESSEYSPNPVYYGALHNTAHIVLGRQGDPRGKFKMPPGVMEHFETSTRDPSFFRLHKYMNNIFKEFKDRLEPYTFDDLNWDGVTIESVEIEGSLETYFEDFEFSLINAVDDTTEIPDVDISASVKRLNHKPFAFVLNINNDNGKEVTASARLYLCPRRDNNGVAFHPNIGRWGCIEMDKFWVNLAPGANTIVRKASESDVTVPDSLSFENMIKQTDEALAAGAESTGLEKLSRTCGLPDRLLLPKGKEEGLEVVLMSFVSDGATDHTDTFQVGGHYGGTHAHCGIHGQKSPDKRAMGFPIDRQIVDFRMTATVTNFKNTLVYVYHKGAE